MAEETENLTEQIGESVNKVEQFVENNKKSLIIGGVVVILLICGFFAYKNLYLGKKQSEALAAMYPAQVQFSRDSFHIALYGNENVTGFEDIVKEYGNTKAGNTANYYAGVCALNLGEFDAAIDYLKDFSTDDLMLEPLAAGLIGDAYSEKEEYAKAASQYEKAAKIADNESMSPIFLMKAGLTYEKIGKKSDAVKAYNKIKSDYSGSQQARDIDKYITRAQSAK
ncbi:MAG: tetratricopeptide repeat protein [Bacteroidales bacterium]|nr:tetratricopeptide repeat protein [Bacteroidales bacterium]